MAEPRPVLSLKADADLDAIVAFIAERDGFARATAVSERVWKTMRNLAFMPGIGSRRPYLDKEVRAFSIAPWIIYYMPRSDGGGIDVLRILDGRRDLSAIFRESQ